MRDAPRLKTEIFVQAFLRAHATRGGFGAVIHKGAAEAGALYVAINRLDGTFDLLGPPPGAAVDDEGRRLFVDVFGRRVPWSEIAERIERLRRIDPDLWLVEAEARDGFAGLDLAAD